MLLSTLSNSHGMLSFPKIPALAGVPTEAELEEAIALLEMATYESGYQPVALFFQHPLSGRMHLGPLLRGEG